MLLMDGRSVERRFNQGFNAQAGSIDLAHKRADSPSLDDDSIGDSIKCETEANGRSVSLA